MASSKETYCLCGQPYNIGQFMIECDCCREWFHGSCVDVKIYQSDDIDKYHCPKCSHTYGPSIFKTPTNSHRHDRYELGAESRAAQAGAPAWVAALAARPPRPRPAVLHHMRGSQLTEQYVRDHGLTRPVLFVTLEGLDMLIPPASTFTVRSVLRHCGARLQVDVIDVRRQTSVRMQLADFVDYFETPPEQRDERVLNVLSLEFTDTNLSSLVRAPSIVRQLDWARTVWPQGSPGAREPPPRPAVQKYCLMSAAGSYTDFHVDFGGTTVWYHVLHGRKIFYLVPPTATNLALYQQWNTSPTQSECFFGDLVEWYSTLELRAGETLLIPTGWVHAVLTPEDSLVFGGNFLHSYGIELQLQINEIERRVDTPSMFRYPLFESMHWYAAVNLLQILRRVNEERQDEDFMVKDGSQMNLGPVPELPPHLIRGIRILTAALKEWHTLKTSSQSKRDNVPKCVNSGQLVRELSRELKRLERHVGPAVLAAAARSHDYIVSDAAVTNAKSKNHSMSMSKANSEHARQTKRNNQQPQSRKAPKVTPKVLKEPPPVSAASDGPHFEGGYGVGDDVYTLPDEAGFGGGSLKMGEKKSGGSVLRIKLGNSPSSSRDVDIPPPAYSLPEHSILKSHLIGRPLPNDRPLPLKPINQWTISKKDMPGDSQEEQILFTNENLSMPGEIRTMRNLETASLEYGAGMYSAEDLQQPMGYQNTDYANAFVTNNSLQSTDGLPLGYAADGTIQYASNGNRYKDFGGAELQGGGFVESGVLHESVTSYEALGEMVTQEGTLLVTATESEGLYGGVGGKGEPQLPSYDAAVNANYTSGYQTSTPLSPAPTTAPAAPRRSERPVRRRVSASYEYGEEGGGELYIDEAPAARRRVRRTPLKLRTSTQAYRYGASGGTGSTATSSKARGAPPIYTPAAPANGIESLIQASVLAAGEEPDTEDAAVAGMLSMGDYNLPRTTSTEFSPRKNKTFGLASSIATPPPPAGSESSLSKRGRRVPPPMNEEPLVDDSLVIKEVHRDDEFVYPSLELSSDEEQDSRPGSARRKRATHTTDYRLSKADKDESWSPRARLGRLLPKLNRPARPGVRREAVRKALQAAAQQPVTPPTTLITQQVMPKKVVLTPKRRAPPPPPPRPPPAPVSPAPNKSVRLKKGMKTAKQRLGKILKIHKMIY